MTQKCVMDNIKITVKIFLKPDYQFIRLIIKFLPLKKILRRLEDFAYVQYCAYINILQASKKKIER